MSGINKAILIGHLGKDPEVRYMTNGDAVVNFSIATSESWKDKATGEKKEQTEWHRVNAFGKLAEICGQYLKKGSKVYIEGSIRTRKYEKEGVDHYVTEIRADRMQMLDSRKDGDSSQQGDSPTPSARPHAAGASQQQKPPYQGNGTFNDFEDDIPF